MIVHYHILKNAGSTIEELLYSNFREKFSRFDTEDRDHAIPNSELLAFLEANPHIQAVSSHQLYDPVPLVPGYIFFDLCFLRDPLERIRSTYDFFRGKPDPQDPISQLANRMTLAEFIGELIENYPWMVTDVQVNQLANGLINDPPQGPDDLNRATHRMLNTSLLGVVDQFAESVVAIEHSMRMIFPHFNRSHAPVNVSRGMSGTLDQRTARFREECGEEIFCELLRRNRLDQELLRRARAELERRRQIASGAGFHPRADFDRCKPSVERTGAFKAAAAMVKLLVRFRSFAFFDAEYYLRMNPDVRSSRPLLHFLTRGAFEGRNPCSAIDLPYYARTANPHPLFDPEFYWSKNEDVRKARVDPFVHYVLHGASELRKPHPWFDARYYAAQCPDALADPLGHFMENCAANPHPLFDCEAYLREHPGLDQNPLVHFVLGEQAPRANAGVIFNVDDVELSIGLSEGNNPGIWQDDSGWTRFSAPAHMRAFFEPLRYPQIHVQHSKPA